MDQQNLTVTEVHEVRPASKETLYTVDVNYPSVIAPLIHRVYYGIAAISKGQAEIIAINKCIAEFNLTGIQIDATAVEQNPQP